ncbi:ATPase domain-containing protein [Hyalangium gracile]|uniref:ATPase domain-containing protein n=1 Tax=Hyalangium gracile TaxID=394092 RepID=UPI001CC99A28|nr:ATPase domain-containing protein [Hyalangium gracile]
MSEAQLPDESARRVPSGLHGLDTLLRGGWLHGGTYIITGSPGTGKTILGNQFCFSAVATGGKAVFITVLAESHGRMVKHLEPMRFFQRESVGKSLHYISGYATLKAEGLSGLSRLIFRAVREHEATVLVVDGLAAVEERAESRLAFREFLHSLCVHNSLAGCTSLMLTGMQENPADPQFAMVDGVVVLSAELLGLKSVRGIEVQKFRGGAQLSGKHTFDITDDGLCIYPRTEALYTGQPDVVPDPQQRLPFGIPGLDQMVGGGMVAYSSTLVFGSPGAGKTLLGLHFLGEGARRGEQCLYYGFTETGPRLIMKMSKVGLDLEPLVAKGRLRLEARVAVETLPDALVQDLLGLVDKHRPQRLFIDGMEPFLKSESIDHQRASRFITAVTNELRARKVTVMMTQQTNNLFGSELNVRLEGVEAIIDNVIFLRFVEMRSQLYRMLSVMKMRESDNDPALRLFSISSRGIHVEDTFESAEAVLTGQARPLEPQRKGKKARRKSLPRRRNRS